MPSSKGIPWDELSNKNYNSNKEPEVVTPIPIVNEIDDRDFYKDISSISRRAAFGLVSGSLTGACFGFVDVLRDSKAMTKNPKVATKKVLQFTAKFGCFFAGYHGTRKVLKLYYPQAPEMNVFTAASICVSPLIIIPSLRPMIPYAIMMVGLDALNGMNDI